MRILKTKTEQVEGGWVAKIYDSGILLFTTDVFETEEESRSAAFNKALEIQNQEDL